MKFEVIPNEQTPELALIQDEFMYEYIEQHREKLEGFLEFARTKDNAVGLACNQVALDGDRFTVRAFALRDMQTRQWRLIIDPVITKCFGIVDTRGEGCLTWKGRTIVAERHRFVEVSYYDMNGNLHEAEIHKGFDAQIWQHEVNHLNGVEEDVRDYYAEMPSIDAGRNEPCPCGAIDSNGKRLKYKKCCLI